MYIQKAFTCAVDEVVLNNKKDQIPKGTNTLSKNNNKRLQVKNTRVHSSMEKF